MYIWDFSRLLGAGSATTRNTRGLTRSVIALMLPPLPAPSRPSNTMQILRPLATTHCCSRTSSTCSLRSSFSYSLRLSASPSPFAARWSLDFLLVAVMVGSCGWWRRPGSGAAGEITLHGLVEVGHETLRPRRSPRRERLTASMTRGLSDESQSAMPSRASFSCASVSILSAVYSMSITARQCNTTTFGLAASICACTCSNTRCALAKNRRPSMRSSSSPGQVSSSPPAVAARNTLVPRLRASAYTGRL
jgi:hypothetical protein